MLKEITDHITGVLPWWWCVLIAPASCGGTAAARLESKLGGGVVVVLHHGHLPTISLETLHWAFAAHSSVAKLVPKFCVSFGGNATSLLGRHTSSILCSASLMIIDFPFLNLLGWLPGSSIASEASGACRETTCQGERVKADIWNTHKRPAGAYWWAWWNADLYVFLLI